MLKIIRTALRMSHASLDDDIVFTINAALLDMSRAGIAIDSIDIEDDSTYDALHLKCVEFYCKWIYDYLGKGEAWRSAYEKLRDAMSLCGDYK